jgi:hypothetical protein
MGHRASGNGGRVRPVFRNLNDPGAPSQGCVAEPRTPIGASLDLLGPGLVTTVVTQPAYWGSIGVGRPRIYGTGRVVASCAPRRPVHSPGFGQSMAMSLGPRLLLAGLGLAVGASLFGAAVVPAPISFSVASLYGGTVVRRDRSELGAEIERAPANRVRAAGDYGPERFSLLIRRRNA